MTSSDGCQAFVDTGSPLLVSPSAALVSHCKCRVLANWSMLRGQHGVWRGMEIPHIMQEWTGTDLRG